MKRVIKEPNLRRKEIIATAERLFKAQGYVNTSVENIIQEVGIAKGTFYYYFKAKQDILDALVERVVDRRCAECRSIAATNLPAMERAWQILRSQNVAERDHTLGKLQLPDNRELQERINVEMIGRLSPILADVIANGNKEGVFDVQLPMETVQLLLSASQFIIDSGLFNWNQEEYNKRILAFRAITERALGVQEV